MFSKIETHVIVDILGGEFEFFTNKISFDKAELKRECEKMNIALNEMFKENSKKNKLPHIEITKYKVMTLEEAIDEFRSLVYDANVEHDESY